MKEKIIKKKLKDSSRKWLIRQMNDPYVADAKKKGYRSRASFKIIEIQDKYKIFNKNSLVVDLGAAPGGWSQIVSKVAKKVVAIDLLPMDQLPSVEFFQGDFLDPSNTEKIKELLDGHLADVIMSDMAPSTCGIQKIDHIRIMNLIEEVFEFCNDVLNQNGSMITKVFQGGTEGNLLRELKKKFKNVHHFKPNSSRKESSEMYLICIGFKRDLFNATATVDE